MYNKIIVIGNLTRDIELKYLSNNTALAKGAIATSHKYKTQSGEQKDEVCFLDFTIFGRVAEVANQYLHKGSKVMLEGRLQFDQWVDNQTGAKRSKHSLMVNEMKLLDSKGENSGNTSHTQQPQQMQPVQNNQQAQKPYQNTQQQAQQMNSVKTQIGDIPDFDDPFNGEEPPF